MLSLTQESLVEMMLKESYDGKRPEFSEMVPWMMKLKCSDSRDRIFGLIQAVRWGASGRTPIVDYKKTHLQLAIEVVDIFLADSFRQVDRLIVYLLAGLELWRTRYGAVGMTDLLSRRKSSYQNSQRKARGTNDECLCGQVEATAIWNTLIYPIDSVVVAVNDSHLEVSSLHGTDSPQLVTRGEYTYGVYSSLSQRELHLAVQMRTLFSAGLFAKATSWYH